MYNTLELFAGCGGLLDGLKQTQKFNTLACVEWQKEQCKVLKKRLKEKYGYEAVDKIVIRFDIQRTEELLCGFKDAEYGESEGLCSLIGNQKVDVITGGPPCQAYSIAGRIQDPDGMKNDYRNYLFESYIKVVQQFLPKMFVFENVEGMLTAKPDGFSIIEKVRSQFDAVGYEIINDIKRDALIDFSEFGIPQKRKRIIIVGIKKGLVEEPQAMLKDFYRNILPTMKVEKVATVKDAIGDLPSLTPIKIEKKEGRKKFSHEPIATNYPQHTPRYHNQRDIEIFRELAYDIESGVNKYSTIGSLQELYTQKTGKTSNIHKYNVLKWDLPSNTIPAHLKKDGLRHIHPDSVQARSITVREAARLQTFDDDFIFSDVSSKDYEMIGNAVPPKFAYKLGLAIDQLFKKYNI